MRPSAAKAVSIFIVYVRAEARTLQRTEFFRSLFSRETERLRDLDTLIGQPTIQCVLYLQK